jgi:sulfate transport system substrate-binding protein
MFFFEKKNQKTFGLWGSLPARHKLLNAGGVVGIVVALLLIGTRNWPAGAAHRLINVSYDPTRELYQAIDPLFLANYEKATGQRWAIIQSHGGSSRQAEEIIRGEQKADVVTLGLFSDVDSLRRHGLIAPGWQDRLPNHAQPYSSTIVFVVRHGNPYRIKDWPDLLAPGLEIITPDPRTSGSGKLAALAAWAAITTRGGTEAQARTYLRTLYQHVPELDEAARGAGTAFAARGLGDVQLAWENEARREVAESKGRLQIVYPPVSILATPCVAWVDSEVSQDHTEAAAKAYLQFLFTDQAQAVIARLGYRPANTAIAQQVVAAFPAITLVPITQLARDWDDANEKFFGAEGVIDLLLDHKT